MVQVIALAYMGAYVLLIASYFQSLMVQLLLCMCVRVFAMSKFIFFVRDWQDTHLNNHSHLKAPGLWPMRGLQKRY